MERICRFHLPSSSEGRGHYRRLYTLVVIQHLAQGQFRKVDAAISIALDDQTLKRTHETPLMFLKSGCVQHTLNHIQKC